MPFLQNPYILAFLTCFMWAGGSIAAIMAVGEVSIFTLMFLRGIVAVSLLTLLNRENLKRDLPIAKQNWKFIVFCGFLGFFIFNILFYLSAYYTTGVNMAIIQGSSPVLVVLGAVIFFSAKTSKLQWLAIFISIFGILALALKGDFTRLSQLSLNKGDLLLFLACVIWACYALSLRYRPNMSGLSFFTYVSMAAFLFAIPAMLIEMSLGFAKFPTTFKGWGVTLYFGLFTAALSQVTYIKVVDKIGAERASIFNNLAPLFTAILAILILNEHFYPYHLFAAACIMLALILAEKGK